jgi:hypothetical protein
VLSGSGTRSTPAAVRRKSAAPCPTHFDHTSSPPYALTARAGPLSIVVVAGAAAAGTAAASAVASARARAIRM